MISYGLDQDLVHKVVSKKDLKSVMAFDSSRLEMIEFTGYAYVGLKNFFNTNPVLFLSRLAKGPPTQYRKLAWSFVASKLKQSIPGEYNN